MTRHPRPRATPPPNTDYYDDVEQRQDVDRRGLVHVTGGEGPRPTQTQDAGRPSREKKPGGEGGRIANRPFTGDLAFSSRAHAPRAMVFPLPQSHRELMDGRVADRDELLLLLSAAARKG